MGALDIAIIGPALTGIKSDFGVSERALSWILGIYVLFNLIGTPLMAKLSDLKGRRSIYLLDVALFALGSLVVAGSPDFAWLLAGRAIQGFGAGGIFPVASAVIGDIFPPEKRGSALGLIGAVFGLAFILGPLLGGLLLIFGWHWLFLINLPIAALILVFGAHLLPATRHPRGGNFDWSGMGFLALGLGSLAFGVNQIHAAHFLAGLSSPWVWPFLLGACFLLAVFLLRENRAQEPILHLDLFKGRQLALAYLLAGGAGVSESSLIFMPLLAVAALRLHNSAASLLLLPVVLAMSVGSPLVGKLLDHYGSKTIIRAGTGILLAGMVLMSTVSGTWAGFILSGALIGLGLSAILGAPVKFIMLNEARLEDRSAAQGMIALFTSMGQLLGGVILGAWITSRGSGTQGYQAGYEAMAMVAVFMFLASWGLKNRQAEKRTSIKN